MSEKELDFVAIDSFELDDHLILLQKNASRVQVLNPLASIIWQLKKSGLDNLQIAKEISNVSNTQVEDALKNIKSIHAQWMLDFSEPLDEEAELQETAPAIKSADWKAEISIFLSFTSCIVRINVDSELIAEKVRRLFPLTQIANIGLADIELNVIFNTKTYQIVKDNLVLEDTETESYTALMVFHHVVDLVCKYKDWLVILHASGVSWKGQGVVFPALGGSGKTTLSAALIKQGFGYINDDVIPLLRNTGELVHLATCLSIKSGSWSLLHSLYPELETLEIFGSKESKVKYLPPPATDNQLSTLYAKHIIIPNYQAGATAELEPLSPVMTLQAIIEGESLLHLPLNKKDIAALIEWLTPLTCHRLTYDKLDSAVALLRQFCMENDDG